MPILFRPSSLIYKVILVTGVILILVISFNVWWNTSLHEASIEKMTLEKTKIVSESLENNILRAMERGRHFDINRILQGFVVTKGSGRSVSSSPTARLCSQPVRKT
jgi:hypothetical protein